MFTITSDMVQTITIRQSTLEVYPPIVTCTIALKDGRVINGSTDNWDDYAMRELIYVLPSEKVKSREHAIIILNSRCECGYQSSNKSEFDDWDLEKKAQAAQKILTEFFKNKLN